MKPGDEIIVTNTDHESNIGGWTRLAEAGAVIKVWEVNRDSLALELADLDHPDLREASHTRCDAPSVLQEPR